MFGAQDVGENINRTYILANHDFKYQDEVEASDTMIKEVATLFMIEHKVTDVSVYELVEQGCLNSDYSSEFMEDCR